ncbi:MAG: DEAD/DEAH box helicase, partial [Phycisphaerae bacterium]
GPTLLVVPMSLVGNWQREIERFAPDLKVMIHHGAERLGGDAFVAEVEHHDVVISTYALTHRDFDHLSRVTWHRLVLDEAQNIKNPSAKQTTAIRRLRARRRVALTGTPLENHLSELWTIMEFLNPGLLGTAAGFRTDFAVPIEKHHHADRGDQLRRLIRPFMLRRRKSDPGVANDLPEKMEMKVYCNLSREQATLYQAVLDEMLGNIESSAGMRRRGLVLAALTRLKQICNHPVCTETDVPDKTPLAGRSGKCERLVEMLDEILAEGERALVFTQFRRMGHLLARDLSRRLGREMPFLHGGTSARGRDQMIARFQSDDPDVPVFLLSLKAGGFGLNLTSATHVFHFDRWWNPAVEDQASDRAHRIGQSRRVQVHKFVCLGTLEERIDQMLEQKRDLADRIIGGGQTWLTELSTDQLRDVLALSQEAVAEA